MKHSTRDGHDGPDPTFGNAIHMMGTRQCLLVDLMESLEMFLVICTCERAAFVGNIALGDYSTYGAHVFEGGLGLESLRCIELDLQFDADVPTGVVNKYTPSLESVFKFLSSIDMEESSSRVGLKMIHRYS